jgi:hypothetical protein
MGQTAALEVAAVDEDNGLRLLLDTLALLPGNVLAQSTSRTRRSKGKACPHLSANLKESYTRATWRVGAVLSPWTSQEEA